MDLVEGRLGGRLRRLRENAALTREQLADLSGVSRRTIAALELGTVATPRLRTLGELFRALDLDEATRAELLELVRAGADGEAESVPTTPRELPPVPEGLLGRDAVVSQAASHLVGEREAGAMPRAWVVSGPPGVGKTTLAVQVAHRVAPDFPDGQIYIALGGGAPVANTVASVLRRMLTALGMHPVLIPPAVEEMSAEFRSRTAGRRVLIVLDDAPSDLDLAPWLPGAGPSAVIMTARGQVASLPNARHHVMAPLTLAEGLELLEGLVGHDRVSAEREDAERLVTLCDWLPGALRMTAAKVVHRPEQNIGMLVDRLADERSRLDLLSGIDFGVRSSLDGAYEGLQPAERRALHLLGELGSVSAPSWVLAAAFEIDLVTARALLHGLADAYLIAVTGHGASARYQIHNLTRLYAAERSLENEHVTDRGLWLSRVLAWWRALATVGADRLGRNAMYFDGLPRAISNPPAEVVADVTADAYRWFGTWTSVVVQQTRTALDRLPLEQCWVVLAEVLTWWDTVGLVPDAEPLLLELLQRCERESDHHGRAVMQVMAATLTLDSDDPSYLREPSLAMRMLEQANAYFGQTHDLRGQVIAMTSIASEVGREAYYSGEGPSSAVLKHAQQARDLAEELGDRVVLADAELGVASVAHLAGRPAQARAAVRRGLGLLEGSGRFHLLSQADWLLAMMMNDAEEFAEAKDVIVARISGLEPYGDKTDKWGLARLRFELGRSLHGLSEDEAARVALRRCAEDAHDLGHGRLAQEANELLGRIGDAGRRGDAGAQA